MNNNLLKIESTLEKSIATLFELGSNIYDYKLEQPVHNKIITLGKQLKELKELAKESRDTLVPIDLIRFIDDAKNPELFLNEIYTMVKQENSKIIKKNERLGLFNDIMNMAIVQEQKKKKVEEELNKKKLKELESREEFIRKKASETLSRSYNNSSPFKLGGQDQPQQQSQKKEELPRKQTLTYAQLMEQAEINSQTGAFSKLSHNNSSSIDKVEKNSGIKNTSTSLKKPSHTSPASSQVTLPAKPSQSTSQLSKHPNYSSNNYRSSSSVLPMKNSSISGNKVKRIQASAMMKGKNKGLIPAPTELKTLNQKKRDLRTIEEIQADIQKKKKSSQKSLKTSSSPAHNSNNRPKSSASRTNSEHRDFSNGESISEIIQGIFKKPNSSYNNDKYYDDDLSDLSDMEVGAEEMEYEERKSRYHGMKEDLEEEERQQREKKRPKKK